MRWMLVAVVLASLGGISAADDANTGLDVYRRSDTQVSSIAMHETTDGCGELADVKYSTLDAEKVACKRVATLIVGGRVTDLYQSVSTLNGEDGARGIVMVVHVGKKLLASPVIAASYYNKLGATSRVIDAKSRLRAIAGTPALDVTMSNIWDVRSEKPERHIPWSARAFMACRIDGEAGTCAFAAFGSSIETCTASLAARGNIHYECVDGKRSEGDLQLISH
jgi:hypothetical protein